MKLKEWILKQDFKASDLAKILKISKGHMSLIVNEKILPKKELLETIVLLTNKQVQPNDFYNLGGKQ
jgi:predicted XRE-type DNA-binding protein